MNDPGPFTDQALSKEFERLREAVPEAVQHRQAFRLVGADFRHLRKYGEEEWVALVNPGEAVAGNLG